MQTPSPLKYNNWLTIILSGGSALQDIPVVCLPTEVQKKSNVNGKTGEQKQEATSVVQSIVLLILIIDKLFQEIRLSYTWFHRS